MFGKKINQDRPDAGTWSGHIDITRAVVTLSVLAGVGLVWLSIAIFIKFQF